MDHCSLLEEVKKSQFWHDLQQGLGFYNLPETVERTQNRRTKSTIEEITMVVLGEPLTCLNLCLEGGKQCPGGMLLVPSLTWLQKEPTNEGDMQTLRVHTAVTFDSCGRTFLDIFTPPRRVTYFTNLATDDEKRKVCMRSYNVDFEKDLECPLGVTQDSIKSLDDRILTRILVADADVAFPDTLAFLYRSRMPYNHERSNIYVVAIENKEDGKEKINKELAAFISSLLGKGMKKVVVKVGVRASGKVTYHSAQDQAGVYSAVCQGLDERESIIVEAFCETLKPSPVPHLDYEEQAVGIKSKDLSCTIRAVVCCTPNGNQLVSDIVCGVGHADRTLHCDNTLPVSLESFLVQWGLQDRSQIENIRSMITKKAEDILHVWTKYEVCMNKEKSGGFLAETSIIGVNFVLTEQEDKRYDAVVVSVNNSKKTIANTQTYEFQNPTKLGSCVRPLVATMVNRSQRFLLQGKQILLIGGGEGVNKKFVWEAAENYFVKIILIDPDPNHSAAKCVYKFIQCDIEDVSHDDEIAKRVVQIIRTQGLVVDGCMTVVDEYVPLTALVCKELCLLGNTPEAATKCKNKIFTQKALMENATSSSFLPNPHLYAVKIHEIDRPEDVKGSSNHIQYPAILKPVYGSSSFGVYLVKDEKECLKSFDAVQKILKAEDEKALVICNGNEMHLAEYALGTRHGVDIVMFRGKILAAFISDCGPSRFPLFIETSSCMPSCLPLDKQRQLVTATQQCVRAVGLTDGVYNIEFKMTPTGPKLTEINGRMSGYHYRNWILAVFDTDILFLNFLIACGIRPSVRPLEPRCQLIGVMCTTTAHAKALSRPGIATAEILVEAHEEGEIIFFPIEPNLEEKEPFEKPLFHVAVKGKSVNEAKKKLLAVCRKYGIENQQYPVERFLSPFVELSWP
ncbi:carnosine synthase 1-like [Lingula anatina]|uniref:Carnosine synthase 1-like n=1 Tax=Lingula anatina TaxID=7574 RepID=A0A1S3HSI4_LINAN|nr:carnosine synthase 1-like [Lingula anatina]|eukprot:XP_013388997.2 carnosine synthase 1-like [Lingula anatina]